MRRLNKFRIPKSYRSRYDSWQKRMSSDSTGVIKEETIRKIVGKRLGIYFDDMKDNRSTYSVDKLYEALWKYKADGRDLQYNPDILGRAVKATFKAFRCESWGNLTPLTLEEVSKTIDLQKSAGLPSFGSKAENISTGLFRAEQVLKHEKQAVPCVAFTRTQFKGKTRLVWGYPLEMTLIEGMYAIPLIEMTKISSPMLYGKTKMDMGAILQSKARGYKHNVGLDFSGFDQTVPTVILRKIFAIFKRMFGEDHIDSLSIIENYFINTQIVMPDGYVYQKNRGIPSGSFFTQIIGSMANYCVQKYMMFDLGIKASSIYVLGDDSILFTNRLLRLDSIAKRMLENFGMTINPDKCEVGDEHKIHMLGYDWEGGFPHEDPVKTLKKLVYPENRRASHGSFQVVFKTLLLQFAATNKEFLPYAIQLSKNHKIHINSWYYSSLNYDDVGKMKSGLLRNFGINDSVKARHTPAIWSLT